MISFLAVCAAGLGTLASVIVVGICIAYSGSYWPLTALLALGCVAWFMPWEVWAQRRRQRQASRL